ncbi:MAG: hypothetical protein TREMPRED_005687 [Tremellales sp. Tagirdzhanova-0007]|nr:MAG: hypothetical protein TREMPRED_005687 [Tremellales sp. Tagirdzhanova-0007]
MVTANSNQVALITGCSEPGSLGASLALELRKRGWQVIATARKIETMKLLATEGCHLVSLDVSDRESIARAVREVANLTGGRLDLLVNNAAVTQTAPFLNIDPERLMIMYDVNVAGPLRVIQAFADMLMRTANDPTVAKGVTKATVLNIGSVAAWGPPWNGAYGSSKAAMSTLSESMKHELGPLGIKVINTELGEFDTPMANNLKPFALTHDTPSPYMAQYPAIDKRCAEEVAKRLKTAIKPAQVARALVDVVELRDPPGKVWGGTAGWMFRYVWPVMPGSLVSMFWRKVIHTDMLERPVFH